MRSTGSRMLSTIFTSLAGPDSLLSLGSSTAFFQSAGTSYFLKAVAPASMALWFMSTMSWPFFR